VDAFPASPDPFQREAGGRIANLSERIDSQALLLVESNLDLMGSLRALNHLFGLNTQLDASRKAAVRAIEQLGERLEQAAQRAGAARCACVQEHMMAAVWLTERIIGSEPADRLRIRVRQMLAGPLRRAS